MFTVYILYSFTYNKTYVGFTSNLLQRFYSHNCLGSDWTRSYRPWVVVYTEILPTKKDALIKEKELKSGKGRDWIRKNIEEWTQVFSLSNNGVLPRHNHIDR
jgi:putative endonuclease